MKRLIIAFIIITIIMFLLPSVIYSNEADEKPTELDPTEVNMLLKEISGQWYKEYISYPKCSFDYAVINLDEQLIYKSEPGEGSETVVGATKNRDTIRDITCDDEVVGRVIIYNNVDEIETKVVNKLYKYYLMSAGMAVFFLFAVITLIYLRVIRPFDKMKDFAEAVSAGDLDKPLQMDRKHVFGAFTESFDIMREELKQAREKELAANISKKELVAQLSHDIKTPVSSIKAMSEVLAAKEDRDAVRDKLVAIGAKADQIDSLVSNLFVSTLEELEKLEVNGEEMESTKLVKFIRDADYNNKVTEFEIPECLIFCDHLRVSQVISNIIYNSYKYADTDIYISGKIDMDYLFLSITDRGGGVSVEELNLITQKYKRGANAEGKQGTGLGLFISKELMENMQGSLEVANADGGFRVTLGFKIA